MTRVAVCAATLHRPAGLAALLDSLGALVVPDNVELTVVIVDNDAAASARPVVDAARERIQASLVYVTEPQRGIPFARNRAVAAAGDVDWIAFVDDDETVDERWLAELLRVAEEYSADVVTGTVLPRFENPPPRWALRGRFFERRRFPTGTAIHFARTSNVLIAARLLRSVDRPFSEAMANNGGDDTHFFQRVRLGGGRIVWADEAVVVETVPASRVRARWLIQREFRRGNTLSLCLRDLEDSPYRRAKRVAAAGVHAGTGLALLVASAVGGRTTLVRGAQRVALGMGLLSGLTGHVYQEYSVVHGH
jgi:succinoglycan biosynthesis protein ExoM